MDQIWLHSGYTGSITQKGYTKISCNPLILLVERRRIELPTFALRTRRSPS